MGGSASLSSSSDASVELYAANLVLRSIKPAEYYARIVALSKQKDLKPVEQQMVNLWKVGRLLIVTHDVVVDSMTLKIKLKKASGAALEAEVAAAAVKGAKGKLGLNKDSDSEYSLTITEPLVLARYGRNLCEWKLSPNPCR